MKKHFFQLFRFGIVGSFNSLLDLVIYVTLTRTFLFFETYYLFAATISFFISGLNSYILNKHWTFKDTLKFHHTQLLQFYISSAIGLSINLGLLALFIEIVQMDDRVAKVFAGVLAGGWNFLLQKLWIFRKKS